MRSTRPVPGHEDVGLQPERTDLAWRRTMMSLVVAAAVFLRWMPRHGLFVSALVLTALAAAFAINLTHNRRFRRAVHGIKHDTMPPDAFSVAAVAVSVAALAILGIYTVLFLPLEPLQDVRCDFGASVPLIGKLHMPDHQPGPHSLAVIAAALTQGNQ